MQTLRNRHELLLVEDDFFTASDAEEALSELGFNVTVAFKLQDALALVSKSTFDISIVDFNLGNQLSAPVVWDLINQNVPVAVVSGAKHQEIKEAIPDCVRIYHKPANYVAVAKRLLPIHLQIGNHLN